MLSICAALLTAAGSASAAPPPYALKLSGGKAIVATYSFTVETQHLAAERWTLYAAQPPNFTWQSDVVCELTPTGQSYQDHSQRHRMLIRALHPVATTSERHRIQGQLVVRATLRGRHLVERAEGEKYYQPSKLTPEERELSLAPAALIDFQSDDFDSWYQSHRLRRQASETPVDYARRTFLKLAQTLQYEYRDNMERHASKVCRAGRSDCGGMSILFAACLRRSGIPARVIAGRWAQSAKPQQIVGELPYFQQHVKAEFYVTDVGWIPVDLSSAVEHGKGGKELDYFGHDHGNFLVMHIDPTIEVETPHAGREVFEWLQGFHYYVNGQGKLDDAKITQDWHVEHLR